MWDDLPKKMSGGTKALIVILIILVLAGLGYIGYTIYKANKTQSTSSTSPSPTSSVKTSGSPLASGSPKVSPSSVISPSPSGTVDMKIPEGETYVIHSTADTNGDSKDETLVITKMTNGKYHIYILSADGTVLWEDKTLDRVPVRVATQTYDSSKETFLSWMLVFTEQSGDLVFLHWNGTKYEIPQNELGI